MAEARRTEAAEQDFENIGYQIAVRERRPEAARQILSNIKSKCDELAALAHVATIGTAAPEIGAGVRLITCLRWVILFRYEDDGVVILRIVDGSRDYMSWVL